MNAGDYHDVVRFCAWAVRRRAYDGDAHDLAHDALVWALEHNTPDDALVAHARTNAHWLTSRYVSRRARDAKQREARAVSLRACFAPHESAPPDHMHWLRSLCDAFGRGLRAWSEVWQGRQRRPGWVDAVPWAWVLWRRDGYTAPVLGAMLGVNRNQALLQLKRFEEQVKW